MKTSRLILLLLLPCFLLAMTCRKKESDGCHYKLRIHNDSDKAVYAFISYDYPDTGLNFQRVYVDRLSNGVAPHKWSDIRDESKCIETKMNDNGTQKLLLFILDAQLVDATPWPQIRQNYQILKRYEYTLDEMRALNFELIYP